MIIDDEKKFTPYHLKNFSKPTYTDHNAIIVKFKELPIGPSREKKCKKITWNLNKKDGWSKFNLLTTNNKRLDNIVYSKGSPHNQLVKDFENAMTKTKFQVF